MTPPPPLPNKGGRRQEIWRGGASRTDVAPGYRFRLEGFRVYGYMHLALQTCALYSSVSAWEGCEKRKTGITTEMCLREALRYIHCSI